MSERTKQGFPLLRMLLSVPLRFKITLPYLVVASLLAALATYQVGRTFASTLEQRFQSQLVDASNRIAVEVLKLEEFHLQTLRTMIFTDGVMDAIREEDIETIRALIMPHIYNNQLYYVEVLNPTGRPLVSFHRLGDSLEYLENEFTDYTTWLSVQKVMAGEQDTLGDKFVELRNTPWGWTIYTAAPVRTDEQLMGIVLVGTPLQTAVSEWARQSIADLTLYDSNGMAIASTLDISQIAPLDQSYIQQTVTAPDLLSRQIILNGNEYLEGLEELYLRGEPTGWVYATTLPLSLIKQDNPLSTYQLISIFIVGFLALIGLGVLVAQVIAKPIFRLVEASQRVTQGDLDVAVDVVAEDEIGYLTEHFNNMVKALKQREYIREMFGRMVSEDVREAVLTNRLSMGGEVKDVTVLFTDVRGFTSLSEKTSPKDVVSLLNAFFGIVTRSTMRHEGVINHFGGDSALAVFGAPLDRPIDMTLRQAIMTAIEIQTGVVKLNAERVNMGLEPLRFGIGINSGAVVAGTIGSQDRFEYTVIGDVVNVAARLQGISRQYPQTPILLPSSAVDVVRGTLPVEFMYLGEFQLKGKEHPVQTYSVAGYQLELPDNVFAPEISGYPLSTAIYACYLHCLDFSIPTIAKVLLVEESVIYDWLVRGAKHNSAVGKILIEHFDLQPGRIRKLALGYIEPPIGALNEEVA